MSTSSYTSASRPNTATSNPLTARRYSAGSASIVSVPSPSIRLSACGVGQRHDRIEAGDGHPHPREIDRRSTGGEARAIDDERHVGERPGPDGGVVGGQFGEHALVVVGIAAARQVIDRRDRLLHRRVIGPAHDLQVIRRLDGELVQALREGGAAVEDDQVVVDGEELQHALIVARGEAGHLVGAARRGEDRQAAPHRHVPLQEPDPRLVDRGEVLQEVLDRPGVGIAEHLIDRAPVGVEFDDDRAGERHLGEDEAGGEGDGRLARAALRADGGEDAAAGGHHRHEVRDPRVVLRFDAARLCPFSQPPLRTGRPRDDGNGRAGAQIGDRDSRRWCCRSADGLSRRGASPDQGASVGAGIDG